VLNFNHEAHVLSDLNLSFADFKWIT